MSLPLTVESAETEMEQEFPVPFYVLVGAVVDDARPRCRALGHEPERRRHRARKAEAHSIVRLQLARRA